MNLRTLFAAGFAALMLTACTTPKTVSYFPDLKDGEIVNTIFSKGLILMPSDQLSIVVNTKSAELNNVLNLPVTAQIIGYSELQSISQSRGTSVYTIDPDGFIDFPLLGKVKAAGLTRNRAGYAPEADAGRAECGQGRRSDSGIYQHGVLGARRRAETRFL